MAYPEGYRKAMRVMELADRHRFPLLTLVDTPGAYPGVAAEQHGQGGAIARSQAVMVRLGVPTVSVVIGEGGSGGAVAIAVADRVLMQENAIYSVISPEGCAAILWRDASQAKKAASAFRLDAAHCLDLGVIEGIVPEPEGGRADRRRRPRRCCCASRSSPTCRARRHRAGHAPPHPPREVPRDGRLRVAQRARLSTLSTGLSPARKSGVLQGRCSECDEHVKHRRRAATVHREADARSCAGAARRLPREARPEPHAGAVRGRRGGRGAAVRRPAARRPAAALRPAARAGRRARELGRPEGHAARGRRAASRGARRGPPARLRRLRGRDPGRAVRRRHGRDLGSRHLRARRGEEGRRPHRATPRRAARRPLDARSRPARRKPARTGCCCARTAASRCRATTRRCSRPRPTLLPTGAGLGVRAEVGRVPGPGADQRRRRHAPQPQRQRPHAAFRRRGAGARRSRCARRRPCSTARSARSTRPAAPASGCCSRARARSSSSPSTCSSWTASRSLDRTYRGAARGARAACSTPPSRAFCSPRRSTTAPRSSGPRASTASRASSPSWPTRRTGPAAARPTGAS